MKLPPPIENLSQSGHPTRSGGGQKRNAGHANISITLDRYGHLMPGSEEEAAGLLDSYLNVQRGRVEEAARGAGSELTGAHTGAQLRHSV